MCIWKAKMVGDENEGCGGVWKWVSSLATFMSLYNYACA